MKYNLKSIALLLVLVISHSLSYGWNARGHMVVAAIAYSQLTDDQKWAVTDLLKNHPDYQTVWKKAYLSVQDDMDLGTYLMMRAATWPDEIRDSTNANHEFHRPQWHYVTYEMHFPNSHVTTLPNPEVTPNVVWAIGYAAKKVNDQQLGKKERAMYLAWLIHLVGDIHQPLHCGSLYDSPYKAPSGDLGGNLFFVIDVTKQTNLHSVWDASLGTGSSYTTINKQATDLQASQTKKGVNLTQDPRAWSLESFKVLVQKGRLNGKLKGSNKKNNGVALPDGYTDAMKEVAKQRGAWGGYRLGNAVKGLKIVMVPDADEDEE